jgi:ABC-type nitrate/sulfonate/bicarbonate transport system permease component
MKLTQNKIWLIWITILALIWLFVPLQVIPSPVVLFQTIRDLTFADSRENLIYNTLVTLKLQIYAIVLSVLISLIISYLGALKIRTGRDSDATVKPFQPFSKITELLRFIPIMGFTIIFYKFFAIGFWMKVAMLTTGLIFFLTTSISSIIENEPRMKYELAKSLNFTEWQAFVASIFKPTMPYILESLRQTAAMGWLMIVGIETFSRTEGGIGAMLYIYSGSNQFNQVYAYLFVIALIAFLEDKIFRFLNIFLFPYTQIKERG